MGGATAIAAPTVIDLVAGSDYADAVPVLQLQGIALLALVLCLPSAATRCCRCAATPRSSCSTRVALGTSCALVFALVPSQGAEGAALANLVRRGGLLVELRRRVRPVAPRGISPLGGDRPAGGRRDAARVGIAAIPGLEPLVAAVLASLAFLATLAACPRDPRRGLRRRAAAEGGK